MNKIDSNTLEYQVLSLVPKNLEKITILTNLNNIATSIPFNNPDEYATRLTLVSEFNTLINSLSSGLRGMLNTVAEAIQGNVTMNDLKQLKDIIHSNQTLVSFKFTLPVCVGLMKYVKKGKDRSIKPDQYQFLVKFVCKVLNYQFQD